MFANSTPTPTAGAHFGGQWWSGTGMSPGAAHTGVASMIGMPMQVCPCLCIFVCVCVSEWNEKRRRDAETCESSRAWGIVATLAPPHEESLSSRLRSFTKTHTHIHTHTHTHAHAHTHTYTHTHTHLDNTGQCSRLHFFERAGGTDAARNRSKFSGWQSAEWRKRQEEGARGRAPSGSDRLCARAV